jgi:hypothetical protein
MRSYPNNKLVAIRWNSPAAKGKKFITIIFYASFLFDFFARLFSSSAPKLLLVQLLPYRTKYEQAMGGYAKNGVVSDIINKKEYRCPGKMNKGGKL